MPSSKINKMHNLNLRKKVIGVKIAGGLIMLILIMVSAMAITAIIVNICNK